MSKESCKLLILGDEGVGKTTLLKRLEKGKFVPNVKRTIAGEITMIEYERNRVVFELIHYKAMKHCIEF